MKDALNKKYELISKNAPEFSSKFSLTDFVEMYRGVTTRTFTLTMDSKNLDEKTTTLVPFGHILNHKMPPSVDWRWFIDEKGRAGWFARAKRDIKKGEQIYASYGELNNHSLLYKYGFIDPEN